MTPLYDTQTQHAAWLTESGHLYDTSMNWIAFTSGGSAFSAATGHWLGPKREACFLDPRGQPVLWTPRRKIEGTIVQFIKPGPVSPPPKPPAPPPPPRPEQPVKPRPPSGGWSRHTLASWLGQ